MRSNIQALPGWEVEANPRCRNTGIFYQTPLLCCNLFPRGAKCRRADFRKASAPFPAEVIYQNAALKNGKDSLVLNPPRSE